MKEETLDVVIPTVWFLSLLVVVFGGILTLNYFIGKEDAGLWVALWLFSMCFVWIALGFRLFKKFSKDKNQGKDNIKAVADEAQENMSTN